MLAEVTAYNLGVFFHVLAVVVGIGATYAHPIVIAWVERFAPASVPPVYAALRRIDRLLVTPGLTIALLSGFYLVAEGRISLNEPWVMVGLVAVISLLGMTGAYFAPRWRIGIEVAERDLAAAGELSDEFKANSRQIAIGGMLASVLVIVTIFFMTVKP